MKILQIVASCDPRQGGVTEGIVNMGDAFTQLGHTQELLTLDALGDAWVTASRFPVHAMGQPIVREPGRLARFVQYLRGSPEAERWLRANLASFDAVIVNGLWNASTRLASKELPGSGANYIVFPHGMLDQWFARAYPVKNVAKKIFFHFVEKRLMDGARKVAFTCQTELEIGTANFPIDPARCANVGFGIKPPPPVEGAPGVAALPPGSRYLLFISRIHEKKGCDLLIEAYSRLGEAAGDVDLVIAGPGEADYVAALKAQAQQSGAANRIHWVGMITGGAKWQAIRGCEAMVLPSHQENFGIVVAEALACGRPVVISDQVNIHDEVTAGQCGLVGPDTADGTEATLRAFLALPDAEREAMGTRGKGVFAERFEMRRTVERLLEIFAAGQM